MNKGAYKPGSKSKDLRRTFSISFGTTNPDGSGFESVGFFLLLQTFRLNI